MSSVMRSLIISELVMDAGAAQRDLNGSPQDLLLEELKKAISGARS